MCTGNPVDTTRAEQSEGIIPTVHSVLAVFCFKGTSTIRHQGLTDGVSTYLALTFGTLLSSQGTDASFVLTLSGFPPGASLRCSKLYQCFSVSLTTLLRACRRRPRDRI